MKDTVERIVLQNGMVIHVVANDMGTIISLMSETEPDKTIGDIAYSKPAKKMISADVYDHKDEYRCTECGANYTSDGAGEFCSECGNDEVFLIGE